MCRWDAAPHFDRARRGGHRNRSTSVIDPTMLPLASYSSRSSLPPHQGRPEGCHTKIVINGHSVYRKRVIAHSVDAAESAATTAVPSLVHLIQGHGVDIQLPPVWICEQIN